MNPALRHDRRSSAERGMATLIVFVLLGLMTLLVLANQKLLRQWDQHLRAIERKQVTHPPLVNPAPPPTPPAAA